MEYPALQDGVLLFWLFDITRRREGLDCSRYHWERETPEGLDGWELEVLAPNTDAWAVGMDM